MKLAFGLVFCGIVMIARSQAGTKLFESLTENVRIPAFAFSRLDVKVEDDVEFVSVYFHKKGREISEMPSFPIEALYAREKEDAKGGAPLFGEVDEYILVNEKDLYLVMLEKSKVRCQLFKLRAVGDLFIEREKGVESDDPKFIEWIVKSER